MRNVSLMPTLNRLWPTLLTTWATVACSEPAGPVPLTSLSFSADSVMVTAGEAVQLDVRMLGPNGQTLSGKDLEWRSADPSVASVTDEGLVRGIDDGGMSFRSTVVIASAEAKADTAKIIVRPIPPSVQVTTSSTKVRVGEVTLLAWTSDRASSCEGNGLLIGVKGLSGETEFRPSNGGRPWARVECVNDGGLTRDSVQVITPFPVMPSSYENFRSYVIPAVTSPYSVVQWCTRRDYTMMAVSSRATADFKHDGTLTVMDMIPGPYSPGHTGPALVCVWERTEAGQWVDISSTLLPEDARGCAGGARKGLVADYNNDERPDVFFLCHGNEVDDSGGFLEDRMEGGESFVVLSSDDGKYQVRGMGYRAFAHGGSAGDIDLDGDVDIIYGHSATIKIDGVLTPTYMTVLENDGTGVFSRRDDLIKLPDAIEGRNHFHIEMIDLDDDGLLDLITASGDYPTTIIWGENGGRFGYQREPRTIPFDQPEKNYNGAHFFHRLGRYFYSWNLIVEPELGNNLQRVSLDSWESEVIWTGFPRFIFEGHRFEAFSEIYVHNNSFIYDWAPEFRLSP